MPKASNSDVGGKRSNRKIAPAETSEARENQLINLSMNLAEKKLRDGTASNSIILHYLKLGTARAELEKEKLRSEVELANAKADSIKSQKKADELYSDAIEAMKTYQGNTFREEYYDDED